MQNKTTRKKPLQKKKNKTYNTRNTNKKIQHNTTHIYNRAAVEGLTVNVDINSQYFPKAYHGVPMSTHFVLVYEKRSWRFVRAERSRCGEFRKYEVEELPELMREELLKGFESFDC
uniref:Uncharacterized protein n=1 Tax=Podoviridae sp. ctcKt3 TaxID=2826566 RepID=A0A8S5N804_9CAUD|nr:MAG TPA: hypothetical protein [Podoviridae sp. ctcKt3]